MISGRPIDWTVVISVDEKKCGAKIGNKRALNECVRTSDVEVCSALVHIPVRPDVTGIFLIISSTNTSPLCGVVTCFPNCGVQS